jgi:Amidohydrolase family
MKVLLSCLFMLAGPAWAAEFVVLIQNQPAGHLRVNQGADGRVTTDFSFRDNGRGPDLKENFRLDADGLPVEFEVTGRTTFGAAVEERFAIDAGRVRWTSRVDRGEQAVPPGFVFLPLEATAGYQAALLRQVLARGSVPTLNGLTLKAELTQRVTLPGPQGPVALALAVVTGADAEPWYAWVRDDGSRAWFGVTWPAWAMVEKGYEALVPQLVERQLAAVDERLTGLRRKLAQPLPGLTLVESVRWFDAPAARMRGPSDVWISAGRIAAITPPGTWKHAKPERTISGQGRTLVPGLWDMHGHFWAGEGLAHLAAGVTGVRDPGNDNAELARTMGRIARGEIVGPTIVRAGFIEGKSPFSSRNGFVVETLEQGLEAVEWYAARGFRSIKIYNSIRPEWVKPLAAHAKALGLKVSGHVPAFMRAEQALRDGYDELTHINQVMLNFVVRDGDDTRTLMRFERVGEDGLKLDLNGRAARRLLGMVKQRGTVIDPTLVAFEAMFTQAQGEPDPVVADLADHLPVLWQRRIRAAEMDLEGARLDRFRQSWRRMLELTLALHRNGATLVAGTDGWSGVGLHRELALLVQAGLSPTEALKIGTWNGAVVAGESERRGAIRRGYAADLLLVDGDPTRRIEDLRRASLVIQGDVAYAPAALYEAMGWKPFVPAARLEPPPNP